MNWMSYLLEFFSSHYYLAYLILFLGSFIDSLIGIGFFWYGEVFFLSGAILAGTGILNIWLVSLVCIAGGIAGDSFGYFIGRKYGFTLAERIFNKKNRFLTEAMFLKGKKMFRKYGLGSIFIGRFTGPASCVFPFLSGTLKVRYRDFLKYNIPASVIGISQFLVLGYFFGLSYAMFLPKLEKYILYLIIIIILIAVCFMLKKSDIIEKFDLKIFRRFIKKEKDQ